MNVRVTVIDAGVVSDLPPHPQLMSRKIARGTQDFSVGAAMSAEQADAALALGREAARLEIERGLDILALGEMGIGNTTSASAIIAAITGRPVERVTGHGTGIGPEQFQAKIDLIKRALALHQPSGADTLAKVGGFEIGALAGLMLGAASGRIPVLIDGVITTAAALIAAQVDPAVKGYLIAGHYGVEPGLQIALDWLGLSPLLDLDLRLGEGTGAVLALPLVEAAMRTLQEMATFDDAGVSGPAE
jgi:nicotinate-nucleotide--dimethylbenzimidazole phosphoribosyltransferase